MRVRRMWAGVVTLTLMAGVGVGFAAPASAAQVWHQGVERASATAACPTSSDADLAIGWSQWAPSWAQWANDGKGGYVCDRSITWAKDTPPPGVFSGEGVLGCNWVGQWSTISGPLDYYAPFNISNPVPASNRPFIDPACSTPVATDVIWGGDIVFAESESAAEILCLGNAVPVSRWADPANPNVWVCSR